VPKLERRLSASGDVSHHCRIRALEFAFTDLEGGRVGNSEVRIFCPKCFREGCISIPIEAMDVEHIAGLDAPDGFRKVQVGAFSDSIELFCMTCGVPALLKGFVAAEGLHRH
jgi:hypothetical protein